MMARARAVFLVNLLQDVNILRPLVFLARNLQFNAEFLVTRQFTTRDQTGQWMRELTEIGTSAGASIVVFEDYPEAVQLLQGQSGILIAASESNLSAHTPTHDVMRFAPPGFLKVTLQHGFECVGFLQSRDHDLAHGRGITFASDVVCGWCDGSRLTSMTPSQRSKLYVTGPTAVMQIPPRTTPMRERPGIVCENLHSVRLNIAGDFKTGFMSIFDDFCAALESERRTVTLRPHPGGQYVLKNNVALRPNVTLNNNPIYKVDLSRYAYGISAPSSVLIDMVLAGIPAGVWRDGTGVMDAGNYDGLTEISSLGDWLDFSREASEHPQRFLDRQEGFLEKQKMLVDPSEVQSRFVRLFQSAKKLSPITASSQREAKRVMFIANGLVPTLQLSFIKPLAPLVKSGAIATDFITEQQMQEAFGKSMRDSSVEHWIAKRLAAFRPDLVVFCRYSGPHAEYLVNWARNEDVPVIYHIDDDLLNIPMEIGLAKHKAHNTPARLTAVRNGLDGADLVYASTEKLVQRLKIEGIATPSIAGSIYCSGRIIRPAQNHPVRTIGYMGFDHGHDFLTVLPAIVKYLRRHPSVTFEIFGSIPKPKELNEFGDRIVLVPPIRNYEEFLDALAKRKWDIGICPLAVSEFNLVKANTKWVEYSSVGTAVIATRGTVYDDCCADGCGALASTADEWLDVLEDLTAKPDIRFQIASRAQAKLVHNYSNERLRSQILNIFNIANYRTHIKERIIFVANGFIPTLQLSFIKPLHSLVENGKMSIDYITVEQLKKKSKFDRRNLSNRDWIFDRLSKFDPTIIVFCRYNGPHADEITAWAKDRDIPVIFHIDDDLLNVPAEIGTEKYAYHNDESKILTVRHLLDSSDLVYASTKKLKGRFEKLPARAPITAGHIYCSGEVIVPAVQRPVRKFGYMASADHAHNLDMVLPAVVEVLRRNPHVSFELFGSIPQPKALEEFGHRVTTAPPIQNYNAFLSEFAKLEWDIGICPLAPIEFNLMKANTKWVEYTSVGAAVVASRGTVYDECCADGCGILATTPDEWLAAIERLVRDPEARFQQVQRAQGKLEKQYSVERLRAQVLDIFELARSRTEVAA